MSAINGHDGDSRARRNARIQAGKLIDVPAPPSKADDGIVDPRDQFGFAPQYTFGQLPQIFEDYVQDNCAAWGGDPAVYGTGFLAMHCGVLHASVKVQTNPLKPNNWRNPNDFALILGKSGENKSGVFRDLTRHQTEWQKAMSRANINKRGGRPAVFMQASSNEALFAQIVDNKGERLLFGCEEGMAVYEGLAAHHRDNSSSQMSNALCAVYDGGIFIKRLAKDKVASEIPEALATLIMVTVIEKIGQWKAFPQMIESGLMARHTVGMIAHPQRRDATKLVPGADEAMADALLKMRGLRDVRLVMSDEAAPLWARFVERKEAKNELFEKSKEAPGLTAWARKYDLRIMSAATIFQLYDFVKAGMIDFTSQVVPATEADTGKADSGTKEVKYITITKENLARAVDFVEGFLLETQRYFYKIAAGVTEFQSELLNFIARRVTTDDPMDPDSRIIPRNDLTHRGPAILRGAMTPVLKEAHRRWITALLDHGIIEVYDKPADKRPRRTAPTDDLAKWYRIRDEVFQHYSDPDAVLWLKTHDDMIQAVRQKIADESGPLKL